MKNVLHLIKEYKGNYPLLNEIVRGLPKDSYRSTVCYLSGQSDGKNELDSIASEVWYLGYDKIALKHINPKVMYVLYKLMRKHKIDIVHCHRHKATIYGTIAAALARVPYIISHVHGLARTRSMKRRFTNWLILSRTVRIIAISEAVREDVIGSNWSINPERVVTVRNGLNLSLFDKETISKQDARLRLNISNDSIVYGTVGRLTTTKGHSYLLEAFAEVRKEIPHARLVIIGDGPLHGALRERALSLEVDQWISFLGHRRDIPELLKGFDIFVLPSVAEGLSLALLEAMASRLPVVATKVGGIPEVLDNGVYGLLVAAKDVLSISTAMKKIAFLEEKGREAVGTMARERVENAFTSEIMHRELIKVYGSIIEENTRGREVRTPRRVLHLIKEYKGNYPLFNEYVKALPADCYRSTVCYLSGQSDGKNELDSIASEVWYLGYDKIALKHINPKVMYVLYKLMRKHKIDIVHCHRHKATIYGTIAAALARVPHVLSTVHGTGRVRSNGRKVSNWLLSKKVSKFIGVSEGVKADLIETFWRIPKEKIVAIPNGISYQASFTISKENARKKIGEGFDGKFLFGVIGRLSLKKNHTRLIDAMSRVVPKRPNIYLLIVGTGPLDDRLKQKVEELGLSENIAFTGYRSDIPVVLRALDAFILPSLPGEGLPLALLEAMGAGLPVIASRIPGVIEVFEGVKMGRLVDPESAADISEAMEWVADLSGADRTRLEYNAREHALLHYSVEHMAERIRTLYRAMY